MPSPERTVFAATDPLPQLLPRQLLGPHHLLKAWQARHERAVAVETGEIARVQPHPNPRRRLALIVRQYALRHPDVDERRGYAEEVGWRPRGWPPPPPAPTRPRARPPRGCATGRQSGSRAACASSAPAHRSRLAGPG